MGSNILVKNEHVEAATRLFEQGGFTPIYVEHLEDGDVRFWFGEVPDNAIFRLATSIPRDFYAQQAFVGPIS